MHCRSIVGSGREEIKRPRTEVEDIKTRMGTEMKCCDVLCNNRAIILHGLVHPLMQLRPFMIKTLRSACFSSQPIA